MAPSQCVVVVGGGQAGARVCEALRDFGYAGRLVLIGEEPHLPYERPPLSKQVLLGEASIESTRVLDREYYAQHGIELRLGERVATIDRAVKSVCVEGGGQVPYDHLVLALGVRPRPLPLTIPSDRITLFRTADDAQALARRLRPGARLLIIGGGFLGLELAAAARKLGCDVTVAEREASLLPRVIAPEVSSFFHDLHARKGVTIKTGTTITSVQSSMAPDGASETSAQLSDGSNVTCDIVLAAIGSIPNTALAESAGLVVRDGIVVDPCGRTSDPFIWAAGDCARHYNPLLQREVRLESWHNAQHQARLVAANIAGTSAAYSEVPWFWSDQYEANLQIVGVPERWDGIVLRGDPSSGRFTAFYLLDGAVVAANTVNNGRDVRAARELIKYGGAVDRERLADPSVKIQALIPPATALSDRAMVAAGAIEPRR